MMFFVYESSCLLLELYNLMEEEEFLKGFI